VPDGIVAQRLAALHKTLIKIIAPSNHMCTRNGPELFGASKSDELHEITYGGLIPPYGVFAVEVLEPLGFGGQIGELEELVGRKRPSLMKCRNWRFR
jgi:hypothetical protein